MTKSVRIENADTSDHDVVVEVWLESADGSDVMERSVQLPNSTPPAEFTIYKGKYLIVREVDKPV